MRTLGASTLAAAALLGVARSEQRGTDPLPTVVTSLTVFAGTPAGLYRSRDWGGTWEPAASPDKTHGLDAVGAVRDVLPVGPEVFLGGDGGVYRSEDFGQTWKRTEVEAPVVRVLPSRYPNADPTVWAATADGLLKSEDGGATFARTALWGTTVHRLEWPGPALVAATSRGVVVSLDGGRTFQGPGAGLPAGEARALALSSFFVVDPVLFAAVGASGVHRSSDGGRSWVPAGLGGEAVTDLAWHGPFLYAVSGRAIFRSEDMGRAWTELGKGVTSAPTRVLFPLMPTSGSELFLGTTRGVFRSADGGLNWRASGLGEQPVLCLATFPQAQVPTKGGPRKR